MGNSLCCAGERKFSLNVLYRQKILKVRKLAVRKVTELDNSGSRDTVSRSREEGVQNDN